MKEKIATMHQTDSGMYVAQIKDEFGMVESATACNTSNDVSKWANEHGVTKIVFTK